MSEAYRQLTSRLPERRAPVAGAFASDPRAVRAWVEALPMANFPVAAKRLLDGLADLNRQRIDGAQRLDALEILRAPLAQLAATATKQILGASFPLPPQKAELGELALDFQAELASGYRTALVDLTAPNGSVPFLRGKAVTLAAARALQHGGEHLAKAYLLYRTPPRGAWQALHDVYQFVAELGLDDRAVVDPLQQGTLCLRDLYGHSLLLALANPYRFTQREQGEVVALTRTLAPYLQLRDRNGGERDLIVHSDADRGPGYLPEERDSGQRDVLALHMGALSAFVDGQLAMVPPGARTATFRVRGGPALHVDGGLVRRVTANWSAHGARTHVRLGGGYTLDTVLGLHDLHCALAGDEDFESFLQHVHGQAISVSDAPRGASWRIGVRAAGRVAHLPARVLDQGLGGYRILWERTAVGTSVRARVADLVGLALPERAEDGVPDWMIGVIRWLRIDEHGHADAGVELLARRALPVGVRALDGAGVRGVMRGLLLAPLAADTGTDYPALLASTEIEREVREVELYVPADQHGAPLPARTVHAGGLRLLEATGTYQHFALAPCADATTTVEEAVAIPLAGA